MESRVATRFAIRVPVEYQSDISTGGGITANVSTSGVRIALSSAAPEVRVGGGVKLRFSFFAGSFDTEFGANVIRHTPDGFAVQFNALDGTQRELLRQALPVPDEN